VRPLAHLYVVTVDLVASSQNAARVEVPLDAHLLADIGRSEAERRRECCKWFWQP